MPYVPKGITGYDDDDRVRLPLMDQLRNFENFKDLIGNKKS
jgi:hypothetical protein